MKKFMDENFLLQSKVARELYHNYASKMPIFDYHCHLSVQEIAENKSYENLTQIWLYGDHYKWRAMRSNGIDEKYITGEGSDYEKFLAFVDTMEYSYGNPLFHWSHLELRRFFGIEEILNRKNAAMIWEKANSLLHTKNFKAKALIRNSNVRALCTTDDPIDSLEHHEKINQDLEFGVRVLPTFRPDKALFIEKKNFVDWVSDLKKVTGMEIENFDSFVQALCKRIDFFVSKGCVVTDHSIEEPFFQLGSSEEIEVIFQKGLLREELSKEEIEIYKTALFLELAKIYYSHHLGMQIHLGALRNNNTRMFEKLGTDVGFDSIGDYSYAQSISALLNELEKEEKLPKTILYCLNPTDNEMLGSMIGNFQGERIPGKIQFGSGWWFNDQKDGMLRQMTTLANFGLLRRFLGMLTDSRSFLSYTRHEYFRRILCNFIGTWVEEGEVPYDLDILKAMIEEICFTNAKNYFSLELQITDTK